MNNKSLTPDRASNGRELTPFSRAWQLKRVSARERPQKPAALAEKGTLATVGEGDTCVIHLETGAGRKF
jgi:hypothetical protein